MDVEEEAREAEETLCKIQEKKRKEERLWGLQKTLIFSRKKRQNQEKEDWKKKQAEHAKKDEKERSSQNSEESRTLKIQEKNPKKKRKKKGGNRREVETTTIDSDEPKGIMEEHKQSPVKWYIAGDIHNGENGSSRDKNISHNQQGL